MTLPPPFRTTPYHATPDNLAVIGTAPGKRAKRAIPDADTVLAEMDRYASAYGKRPRRAQLEAWAAHPDERVPIRLAWDGGAITSRHGRAATASLTGVLDRALTARAVASLEREGLVWTPVLDAVARCGQWNAAGLVAGDGTPLPPSAEEMATRLIPWIASQTSSDALRGLRKFQFGALWPLILRHATCLDAEWLDVATRGEALADAAAANPSLTTAQQRTLAEWAIGHPFNAYAVCPVRSHKTIHALRDTGYVIPRELTDPLLIGAMRPETDSYFGVVETLGSLPEALDPTTIVSLFQAQVRRESIRVMPVLLDHPASGPALWDAMAQHCMRTRETEPLLDAMAAREHLHRVPSVREAFMTHRAPRFRAVLLRTATPAEFHAIAATFVPRHLETLAHAIATATPAQVAELPRAVWEALRHPAVADEFDQRQMRQALAHVPAARAEPALRAELWKGLHPTTMTALFNAPELPVSEIRREFAKLCRQYGQHLEGPLSIVEAPESRLLRARLRPKDMTPFFESASTKVRQRALIVAGTVGGPAEPALESLPVPVRALVRGSIAP